MTPIGELRASIPIGIGIYHLHPLLVLAVSVLGNMVPITLFVFFLKSLSEFLSNHSSFFKKFFNNLFYKTEINNKDRFIRFKAFALTIFVAVPLPLTGAWTASLCAFVFNVPPKVSIPSIALGVLIAGIIVTLGTLSLIKIF